MGFFDSAKKSINRGAEAAQRTGKSAQLKMRLNDLTKERQKLAGQLGAGLYDKLKDDPAMREGLEALFDGIAAIDLQKADIQGQIDALEAEAQASQAAAVTLKCPDCGSSVGANDLFCTGCGKPIAEIRDAFEAQQHAAPEAPAAAYVMPEVYDTATLAPEPPAGFGAAPVPPAGFVAAEPAPIVPEPKADAPAIEGAAEVAAEPEAKEE